MWKSKSITQWKELLSTKEVGGVGFRGTGGKREKGWRVNDNGTNVEFQTMVEQKPLKGGDQKNKFGIENIS